MYYTNTLFIGIVFIKTLPLYNFSGYETTESDYRLPVVPFELDQDMSCKYKVRLFHSKGAYLVVFWLLLMCIACIPSFNTFIESFKCWFSFETRQQARDYEVCLLLPNKWLIIIPVLIASLSAPAAGWMADAKFGNYRMF